MSYKSNNLFAELTADGQTASFELPGAASTVSVFLKEGASDGTGTLKMQSSFDGGTTWVDVPDATWTSGDGHLGTYTVHGSDVRFDLASSTSPSDMIVQVNAVAQNQWSVHSGNFAADGSVDVVLSKKPDTVTLFLVGDDGTGTVTLQYTLDGGTTWYNAASMTAAGGTRFDNSDAQATVWKVDLADATDPVLDWYVVAA